MKIKPKPSMTEAAIWLRVIHPNGELTPAAARAILKLEFDEADCRHMHELAAKAQEDILSPDEEAAADNYERVGTMLAILKSKARQFLKKSARRNSA